MTEYAIDPNALNDDDPASQEPDAPPRLRVSSPHGLVELVPYLIGFTPTESLVMVSLTEGGRRVGLSLRADLPALRDGPVTLGACRTHLRHAGAESVFLLVYTRARAPLDLDALPERDLVEDVRDQLAADGMPTRDCLLVVGDRWWSYQCRNPSCCPPEGNVRSGVDAPSALTAAAAVAGLVPVPDREALAASVQPLPEAERASLAERTARTADEWRIGDAKRAVRAWREGVRGQLAGERPLDEATAALVLVGLSIEAVRDLCVDAVPDEPSRGVDALLRQLTRRASPPFDVAPAALLGWFAWLDGDGALARIAAEQALRSDPGYDLALLIEEVINAGVDPRRVRAGAAAGLFTRR